jgi:hypothetical protein
MHLFGGLFLYYEIRISLGKQSACASGANGLRCCFFEGADEYGAVRFGSFNERTKSGNNNQS